MASCCAAADYAARSRRAVLPLPSSPSFLTTVAVKCRPLTDTEQRRSRHIIQVIDDKTVVVLDPDLSKDYLDLIQNRTKERRYTFDHVYAPGC